MMLVTIKKKLFKKKCIYNIAIKLKIFNNNVTLSRIHSEHEPIPNEGNELYVVF